MTGRGKVYVASSWRNSMQQGVVHVLRAAGFEVYDFQNPPNGAGFGWEEVMPSHGRLGEVEDNLVMPADYIRALVHPRAVEGFESDFRAMHGADTFVLVLPCGRSAHLELGWAVGQDKRTAILLASDVEPMVPELMYLMVDHISPNLHELLGWLGVED